MRLKTLLLTACAFFVCAAASAGNNKVYLYGFAASFNDSTVYFTDIQELDSAVVDRGGFLYGRDSYSYHLRDYLASKGFEHATCVTMWATKRDVIEKKFQNMRSRYGVVFGKKTKKKNTYTIKYLTTDEFHYQAIVPDESQIVAPVKSRKKK